MDISGKLKKTVLGDYVGKLTQNASYALVNFMVKDFMGEKRLTMGRSPQGNTRYWQYIRWWLYVSKTGFKECKDCRSRRACEAEIVF